MNNNKNIKRNNSVTVMLNFAIDTLSLLTLFRLFLLSLDISAIWLAYEKPPYHMDRQISVLSTVARVFESLVYDQLSYFMEQRKYLSQYQSEFRKFHSTIRAMLKNSNDWLLNMDKELYNGVVLFDIEKAFVQWTMTFSSASSENMGY